MSPVIEEERGAAYVEFLIAFPPIFTLFMCLVQLAMMYVGKLAVAHASTRAVRAAIVVLPDDPQYYGGEPVNHIDYQGSGTNDSAESFYGAGGSVGTGSSRIRSIRSAAYIPLTPLAPSTSALFDNKDLRQNFERGFLDTAVGALLYGRAATSVSFPETPRQMRFIESFDTRSAITARVTYMFYCGVPIADKIMCEGALELLLAAPDVIAEGVIGGFTGEQRDRVVERGFDYYRNNFRGRSDITNGVEEMQFAEAPYLLAAYAFTGGRFVMLRAESTLPNQGAEFVYAQ